MDQQIRPGKRLTSAISRPEFRGRQRSGRIPNLNPNLIPLLRDPSEIDLQQEDLQTFPISKQDGDLDPARGILFGILLSVPLWAILFVLFRLIVY